jgi:alkylhydroperoxidase family enzyme
MIGEAGAAERVSSEDRHAPYRECAGDPPAWVPVVDAPDAEGALADVYARIGAPDEVAHIIGVQSLHPKALEAHVRLYRTIMFDRSPLSRVQRESIAVVVSAINDCFY